MESKYLNFLLNENEINRIANEVGLCKRIRKFTPMELLKMVTFSPNNIAKDILNETYDMDAYNGVMAVIAEHKKYVDQVIQWRDVVDRYGDNPSLDVHMADYDMLGLWG